MFAPDEPNTALILEGGSPVASGAPLTCNQQIVNVMHSEFRFSRMTERPYRGAIVLAFGANVAGRWGQPATAIVRAMNELQKSGVIINIRSEIYLTDPVGNIDQPVFYNAVALVQANSPPAHLLRLLKRLERAAGRRQGAHWGPRPLDIDLIDFKGLVLGWPARQRISGRLVLPHPLMHARAFVLGPLMDIAPFWRHPVIGRTTRSLWLALPERERRGISRMNGRKRVETLAADS